MIPRHLAKAAVDAALAWSAHKPWQRFSDLHTIAVRVAGEAHPLLVAILGASGQQFGLACYRGERALDNMRHTAFQQGDDRLVLRGEVLVMDLDRPGSVPPEARMIHATAGYSARIVPLFFCHRHGEEPREARAGELRTLTNVLRGLTRADEQGLLAPAVLGPSGPARILTVTVRGDARDLEVTTKFETLTAGTDTAATAVAPPGTHDPAGLPGDLPLLDARWAVSVRPVPARISGEQRPVFALTVADDATGAPIAAQVLVGADDPLVVRHELFLVLAGANQAKVRGIPRELAIASESLWRTAAPILEARGARCTFEPELRSVDEMQAALFTHLATAPEDRETDATGQPADPRVANEALMRRVVRLVFEQGLDTRRAVTQYLGSSGAEIAGPAMHVAFAEWLLVHFRGSKNARTLAERLLTGDLPEAERDVLRQRVESPPGIYLVEEILSDAVVLRDLVSGRTAHIGDPTFVGGCAVGDAMPGTTIGPSQDAFPVFLGPPLPAAVVPEAVAHLRGLGLSLTAEGLARRPHLFGRLWTWIDRLPHGTPVQLTNTDGDPLAVQTAVFRVARPDALIAALRARPDIEDEEAPEFWRWYREDGERRLSLAGLRPIDDQLLVEVNSDARLSAVRSWLAAIDGVTFERTTVHDLRAPVPADDRLADAGPREVPAETRTHVEALLRNHYRGWLDEPLPALGGKTPRQAVRTQKGRVQVELLIRTMPDPGGIPGLRAPRAELLRELGLEGGVEGAGA